MKSNHRLCFLIALEIILLIAPLGVANAVVWPLSNSSSDFADTPTSPFGIRRHSDARIYDRHEGLDLHADCGTPVHGIEAADILELHPWDGTNSSGNWVLLGYKNNTLGQFLHLQSYITVLLSVDEGQIFAYSGNTGSDVCHLHYAYIYNYDYTYGPRINPICQLPFWDHICPELDINGISYIGGNIDYIDATTFVPKTEMDFANFGVWLYKNGDIYGQETQIYVDDYNERGDNNAEDAEYHGNFTFFEGDPDYEVSIQCRPRNYNTGDSFHIIDWRINPANNFIFPDENWLGIYVNDFKSNCTFAGESNWGNCSSWTPELIVSKFSASLRDSMIVIDWEGLDREGIEGMNILRSVDSLWSYSQINIDLLPIGGDNNEFVDHMAEPGNRYFYTYEVVYSDGRRLKSGVYVAVDVMVPTHFSLEQNIPNPFNPNTTISYSVPPHNAGVVTLDVFNILGQKIISLVNGQYSPGFYSVDWDGTDAAGNPQPSGIYLYRLSSPAGQLSKKMLLLK